MKNYKIGIGLTAVGIVYLTIIFLTIPIADRIWFSFADIALSLMWILVFLGGVLTIFGIFNIITNKITNKKLLKYLRVFGYISFITGIALPFFLNYISLVLIISGIFMIYIGIKEDEDFLD